MNIHTRRAEGTRKEKTEKSHCPCAIPKGIYQEQSANDHKENERAPTKLPRSRKNAKDSKKIETEKGKKKTDETIANRTYLNKQINIYKPNY